MNLSKRDVVIVGMARTAIGNFLGSLSGKTAVELGIIAGSEAMKRAGVTPDQIDEVLTGTVYKTGLKGNPARQIQIALGIPVESGAVTIEQQCASSMRALEIGAQQIQLAKTGIALITGIESMSNVPYIAMKARSGARLGSFTMEDDLLYDALHDAFDGQHVGITAERVAERYQISREECDALALLSNQRALAAIAAGKFKEEIVPVEVKTRKKTTLVDTDEHPRDTSIEALSAMRPAFKKDGVITAGNASGLNDAASAAVIMAAETAEKLGLTPLAVIRTTVTVGVEPEVMGIGPIKSVPKALSNVGLSIDDIDYFELNEAFSSQFIACQRELGIPLDKINLNGSGISLGHPVGATGLRIVMETVWELHRQGKKLGCASLCVGGGPSMATIVEAL